MEREATTVQDLKLRPLDRSKLCQYERWAQDFFTNPHVIDNPILNMTLQLDVTAARRHYEAQAEGSFTAFLYFYLIQALKNHPEFFYRYIDQQWQCITNPPLFFTVARGCKKDRFYEAFIPDIFQLDWPEFAHRYRAEIERSKLAPQQLDNGLFLHSLIIGNLPNLHVTGLTLHSNDRINTQPMFYFGKRYHSGEQLWVSLCIKFHLATVDPFIVDLLIQDFQARFQGG